MIKTRIVAWIVLFCAATFASSAEPKPTPSQDATVAKPEKQFLMRYRFAPNEVFRTKVVHQAAVRTTIEGTSQTAKTVSISVKVWRVTDVNETGEITFEHSVDYVDMKNDVSGRESIHYDSRTDETPPSGFEEVAKRVGVPLTRVVMDTTGKVLKREELQAGANGASQLTLPLPEDKVAVGGVWTFPYDTVVNLRNGTTRSIKCRQRFELQEVDDDVATIAVATQVLTPIKDFPEIQAQLIQRESAGTIRFDLTAGKVIGQVIDLDRRLTGYPNAKSTMHYRTRFTEDVVTQEERTAERPPEKTSAKE